MDTAGQHVEAELAVLRDALLQIGDADGDVINARNHCKLRRFEDFLEDL
jgi:hypothetical protein